MSTTRASKPIIGLTGGIGAGKSLVARQLASLGCAVIDSDQLARAILTEPAVRDQLVRWWGRDVLNAQGQVDRQAVGRLVFADAARLTQLEDLVHPRVHQRRRLLRRRYLADPKIVAIVEDSPLLLEKGLDADCDVVIFVNASRLTRLHRVAAGRGWDEQELDRRQKNQLSLDIKAQQADYVVDNDASEAECFAHVRQVLSQILDRPE